MINLFKELNEAMISYTLNMARQTSDYGQKMWKNQVELTNNIISSVPGLEKFTKKD